MINSSHNAIQRDSEIYGAVKRGKSDNESLQVASTTLQMVDIISEFIFLLFASVDTFQITKIIIIFFGMIGLWCFMVIICFRTELLDSNYKNMGI